MDKIPVSIGVSTDLRSTMPGASFSTGMYASSSMFPFPSIGSPNAFTTLPIKPFPAGTPAFFFVLTTLVPSLIPVSRPNKMHPISF